MLKYASPEMEVLRFRAEDIILLSGGYEGPDPNPGSGDPGDVTDPPGGSSDLDTSNDWFN